MTKSKVFLAFCLSFIFGIFIQSLFGLPRLFWLGILILGVMAVALCWARWHKAVTVGFCLVFLVGGAWRYAAVDDVINSIKHFNDKEKTVLAGEVVEEPDVRSDNAKYVVAAQSPGEGKILVVAKKYPAYHYGDKLEIAGQLKTPSSDEDFDYQKYLAKDDIYSIVYYPEIKILAQNQGHWLMANLLKVKNKFKDSVSRILKEPQAALLGGLLLGEKRGLPEDLMAAFSRTGTTHIIALSGFNITIIAVALMSLFNFFMVRRQVSFWISVAIIILFVLMVGAGASVVRAAVMGILILLAQQAGRLYQIKNALVFAGALMIFINPKVLVWDVGFQLSFAATLGLVYISPILQKWLEADKDDFSLPGSIGAFVKSDKSVKLILVATLSAQIAVLPLLVVNFGQLSLISPLANLLVLPVIPITMLFGFLAALAGLLFLPLGQIFGWLSWLFLTYEIKVIELLAKIPLAAVSFKWTWLSGGIYYAVLIWLICRFNKKIKNPV
ncbi:MAG: ComEC/Rec2 family competence protein [Candidatus Portnoybacteria bacterium]|nr:ComEC/Rec2 family competence protein [Candidatus Portnoybacteria bacterium]